MLNDFRTLAKFWPYAAMISLVAAPLSFYDDSLVWAIVSVLCFFYVAIVVSLYFRIFAENAQNTAQIADDIALIRESIKQEAKDPEK